MLLLLLLTPAPTAPLLLLLSREAVRGPAPLPPPAVAEDEGGPVNVTLLPLGLLLRLLLALSMLWRRLELSLASLLLLPLRYGCCCGLLLRCPVVDAGGLSHPDASPPSAEVLSHAAAAASACSRWSILLTWCLRVTCECSSCVCFLVSE